MSGIGVVFMDGDVPSQCAFVNSIRYEANKRSIIPVKGINDGWQGLLGIGYDNIGNIVKDLTARELSDGTFLSPLQNTRHDPIAGVEENATLREFASGLENTWKAMELDYLVISAGIHGLTSFRKISEFLPDYYHKRIVLVPKSMNGDVGRQDMTKIDSEIERQSPIYNMGLATAASVAARETKFAMMGCYNGKKLMIAKFLGGACGWVVSAAQKGGALVAPPEMFIDNTVEDMTELMAQRVVQAYEHNNAAILAVSEAIPTTEEEREELVQMYTKRTRWKSQFNGDKASIYRAKLEECAKKNGANPPRIRQFDITYQARFRPPTEFEIRVARRYGQAAIAYLKDPGTDEVAMVYLEQDALLKKDAPAMGTDLSADDIKFAQLESIALQPLPQRYLKRSDGRTLCVGHEYEPILEHYTYSNKFDAAFNDLLSSPE